MKKQIIKLYTVALAIISPCFVFAEAPVLDAEEIFNEYFKDWYQIEIIVFERIEKNSDDPELWPVDITLDYIPPFDFLIDPNAEKTEDDDIDALKIDTEESGTAEDIPGENNSDLLLTLKQSDLDDPLNKKYRDAIEKAELDRLTPKEQPMTLLEEELKSLTEEAHIIGRNPYMRLLNHSVWRQGLKSGDQAPHIVITGGDEFGEHFELEGSIKLHLSRYLHIQTNLWLSQFEANIDQENEHWPTLPLRPRPQIKVNLESEETEEMNSEPEGEQEQNKAEQNSEMGLASQSDDKATENGAEEITNSAELPTLNDDSLQSFLGENRQEFESPGYNNQDFGLGYKSETNGTFGESTNRLVSEFESETETPYVTTQIVSLKQKRRMRSGELHYIDHPKLGILITLSKYEPQFNSDSKEVE